MNRLKFLSLFLFLPLIWINGQNLNFVWLTDVHVGYDKSDSVILKQIEQINSLDDVGFVVVTGDISELGKWDQLEKASNLFKKINKKVFVIPGNHDVKWTEMGGMEFSQIFDDNKFRFDTLNYVFLGLNTGIVLRGGGGHITPEDIKWLEENLEKIPLNKEVFFFAHHPLNHDVDNWYKVTNLLRKRNLKAIMVGHGHVNKELDFDFLPGFMGVGSTSKTKLYGFNVVELTQNNLKISSVASFRSDSSLTDTVFTWYNSPKVPGINPVPTDSSDFIDYKVAKKGITIDLKKTMVSSPVPYKTGFIAATLEGVIYNYDLQGELLWWVDLNANVVSRPVIIGKNVFAGNVGGDIYQIDLETGDVLQSLGISEAITSQLVSFPAIFRDRQTDALLIGTSNGTMYAYEATDLTPMWKNEDAKGRIESLPIVLDNRVVFSAWDGMTYCIDLRTGKLNWKWSENVNFYYSTASCIPVTNGDYVWVVSPDKSVSCIDVLLGKTQWSNKDFNAWESLGLSQDGKTVFIKSIDDDFHTVNAANGKKIKSWKLKWGLDTNPIQIREFDNNVLFGRKNGKIVKFRKDKFTDLFYLGQARPLTIENVGDTFIASNMDGRILLFTINK